MPVPALAGDEDRRRRIGDALQDGVEIRDAARRPDDAEARGSCGRRGARVGAAKLTGLQRLRDDLTDFVLVERLGDEIERAALERFDGGVDAPVRRDEDDRQLRLVDQRSLEESHAIDLRHFEIGDNEIDVVLAQSARPCSPSSAVRTS